MRRLLKILMFLVLVISLPIQGYSAARSQCEVPAMSSDHTGSLHMMHADSPCAKHGSGKETSLASSCAGACCCIGSFGTAANTALSSLESPPERGIFKPAYFYFHFPLPLERPPVPLDS